MHQVALRLVEADLAAATLECTAVGPTLECRGAPMRVAVVGDCAVRWSRAGEGDRELTSWRSWLIHPGDRLRVGPTRGQLRAYIGVRGGIDVPRQLGSRSASLRGGLTGQLNRPLRTGDVLAVGSAAGEADREIQFPDGIRAGGPLRVCVGPHARVLAGELADVLARPWRVSSLGDRTGVRLDGEALSLRSGADVPSLGCPPGAVQVGGNGQPIILGCERGTTGGYAVVAVVVSADLARVGRLRPGQDVAFSVVDAATATDLARRRAVEMQSLVAREVQPGR